MNGIQFIKKAKEQFPDVYFYILTSYEINSEIHDSLHEGLIVKFFRKPFNLQEIKNSINEKLAIQ
jgi:YesN/AraC family two-component response regulator